MAASTTIKNSRPVAPAALLSDITITLADGLVVAGERWTHQNNNATEEDEPAKHKILCLHGWLDNCRTFHYFAPHLISKLSSSSVELVTMDFPGHGLSAHKSVDGPPTLLTEGVFVIAEVAKQLNWQKDGFTIIGHSMGAAMSMLYAAAFPDQIKNLVMLEGTAPIPKPAKDVTKHIRDHVMTRQRMLSQQRPARVYPSLQAAVETRVKTVALYEGDQYISVEAATEMVKRAVKEVDGGVQFQHDSRLYWPSIMYYTIDQVEQVYTDISCPVCLLVGEDGMPIPPERMNLIGTKLRPTVMKTLPGSHHFHADPDTCEAVVAEVARFLDG